MVNFINNGGFEWILGTGYLIWILIIAKIDNKKVYNRTNEKWNWK